MKIIGGILGLILGAVITQVFSDSSFFLNQYGLPAPHKQGGVIVGCCVAGIILGAILKYVSIGGISSSSSSHRSVDNDAIQPCSTCAHMNTSHCNYFGERKPDSVLSTGCGRHS